MFHYDTKYLGVMNISGNYTFLQHYHLNYTVKLLNPFLTLIQDACFKKNTKEDV